MNWNLQAWNLKKTKGQKVFNIAVCNCDDHLLNHGFLLSRQGWELSPAYDINLDPYGTGLSLNITDNDNRLDMELVKEIAPFIEISPTEADMIINRTMKVVCKMAAHRLNLPYSTRRTGQNEKSIHTHLTSVNSITG